MNVQSSLAAAAGALLLAASLSTTAGAAPTQHIRVTLNNKPDGTMTMLVDHSSIVAGPVIFDVKNQSKEMEHEMLVVKTPLAPDALPKIADGSRIDESKLKGIHEVGDMKPGHVGTMKLTLTPGHYVLFCNRPGHTAAGMSAELTVIP